MDDTFLAALFPRRHRILRVRLRPYCYGHFVALAAARSPFLAVRGSGATADAGALVAALRICSAPGFPFLPPDKFGPRPGDVLRRWWLERRPGRLRTACQAFRDYLDDYSQFPEFWEEESLALDEEKEADGLLAQEEGGRPLSAPLALARVTALISRTSVTLAEAWQMPVCWPVWLNACLDEMEGAKIRFLRAGDVDGSDIPPEIEQSEKQIYAQAVKHLGRKRAGEWWRQRKAAAKAAKRKKKKELRHGSGH